MSAFWKCDDCGKEYLGPDNIPVANGVRPMCFRCQELYNYCIVCDMDFTVNETGDPTGDLCNDCWEANDPFTRQYLGILTGG